MTEPVAHITDLFLTPPLLSRSRSKSHVKLTISKNGVTKIEAACFTAFKPRATPSSASYTQGTKQYQLRKYAEQTLGSGNLRNAVVLPEGEDANEWIAVHGEFLSVSWLQ